MDKAQNYEKSFEKMVLHLSIKNLMPLKTNAIAANQPVITRRAAHLHFKLLNRLPGGRWPSFSDEAHAIEQL